MNRRALVALVLAISLAACSTILAPVPEPTKFLVLTPISASGAAAPVQSPMGKPLVLGLGPVNLPQYLDRPEVVMRTSQNTLELSPIDRWAEPLKDNFRSVLAADLTTLLGTSNIVSYPWFSDVHLDYAIRVDVEQFEVNTEDGARLLARWTIADGSTGAALISRETSLSEPMNSHDAQAIAAGLSAALADLSRQIAGALRQQRL